MGTYQDLVDIVAPNPNLPKLGSTRYNKNNGVNVLWINNFVELFAGGMQPAANVSWWIQNFDLTGLFEEWNTIYQKNTIHTLYSQRFCGSLTLSSLIFWTSSSMTCLCDGFSTLNGAADSSSSLRRANKLTNTHRSSDINCYNSIYIKETMETNKQREHRQTRTGKAKHNYIKTEQNVTITKNRITMW